MALGTGAGAASSRDDTAASVEERRRRGRGRRRESTACDGAVECIGTSRGSKGRRRRWLRRPSDFGGGE